MDDEVIAGWEGPSPPVPRSKLFACAVCACPVWIAPTGQRLIRRRGVTVMCLRDALARRPDEIAFPPGALEEEAMHRSRNN